MGNSHSAHATLARLKRQLILGLAVVFALPVTLGACGGGGDKKSTATTLLGGGDVGSDLAVPTTPAPTVAPVTTAAPVTASGPACPRTSGSSEIVFESGLKLALSVSKTCPKVGEDITLTLNVTNGSNAVVHYDPNQAQMFTIKAPPGEQRPRWEDDDCNPPTGDRNKPAVSINAGQTTTFKTTFPGPAGAATREKCRKLVAGSYDAMALLLVCEGAAYVDGYCDLSKDAQYNAEPVRLTLLP